jgi:molybdopterin converting factor small subunit
MSSTDVEAGVIVRLPAALAPSMGSQRVVEARGATVREIIAALDAAYPGMRFALCLETGELRPFVNVFVNGTHVRYARGMETPTPAGATVHIFQSVAGG